MRGADARDSFCTVHYFKRGASESCGRGDAYYGSAGGDMGPLRACAPRGITIPGMGLRRGSCMCLTR